MISDDPFNDYDEINYYINESFRMVYHNEQNEKKIFWWWLNKFEYLANATYVSDEKMAELFIEMVHEDIHKRVTEKYPAINFTELSYEEIINYYICYFNHSPEILSERNSFKHRNYYEQKMVRDYACELRDKYNNSTKRYRLEYRISIQYLNRFNDIVLSKYIENFNSTLSQYELANLFAQAIEIAHYINPALSMIKSYNPKNTGNFHEWLHKFEYVANITKIPDNRMIEFFNNMVDNDVHSAVKRIYLSINSSELPYEEIINFYLQYFSPSDDNDLNKMRLLSRKQYKEETIESYANCLRKLSDRCSNTSRLDEILLEQFLNGIYDNEILTILKTFHCFSFNEMVVFATELLKFKEINSKIQLDHTRLKTFHSKNEEEFYEWLNKFEFTADILPLSEVEAILFFMNMVHNDVHTRFKKSNPDVNFFELSYQDLINNYLAFLYLSTDLNVFNERFMCRKQYEQETIEHYSQILQRLYYICDFKPLSDKILRDQFCNGIHDYKIKTYIGKYPNLSLSLIVAIATGYSNELSFMENE